MQIPKKSHVEFLYDAMSQADDVTSCIKNNVFYFNLLN